jgi:hypothetical protein
MSKQSSAFVEGIWASDEQAWSFARNNNPRNQCYVPAGTQSSTNIQRFKKGDEHKAFSLWWVVCQFGVVCYHLYLDGFTIPFNKALLLEHLKPAVRKFNRNNHLLCARNICTTRLADVLVIPMKL